MKEKEFKNLLETAQKRCQGYYIFDEAAKKGFDLLYPFTTENISGYINNFDLKNKSLLTVGSSLDQALNATLQGCSDITVADINPYIEYYYYLKKAAILCLTEEEFLKYFCLIDYQQTYPYNYQAFSLETFDKIKFTLMSEDIEAYNFWHSLFRKNRPIDVRKKLFFSDESKKSVITNVNPYLKNKTNYALLKKNIINSKINFMIGNIFNLKTNKKYDNIWLSNIGKYITLDSLKSLVNKLDNNLNDNGKMLICYLYQTIYNTEYKEDWNPIYDLDKTFNSLNSYNIELESFTGIKGILFKEKSIKDSILVYKKKK